MVDPTAFWLSIIGAVAYGIVQIIIAWNTSRKVSDVHSTAKAIERDVNSAASAAREKIAGLEIANSELRQTATELKTSAALIAQAAAVADARRQTPPAAT